MKRGHSLAPLVKLFAAEKGKSLRTAQYHAKNDTEEWRAFMATHAQVALSPGKKSTACDQLAFAALLEQNAPPPPPEDEPDDTAEKKMVRKTYALWLANVHAAEVAANSLRTAEAAGFAKVASELQKSYHAARKAVRDADIEARRLLPAAEYEELVEYVTQLAGIFRNAGIEVASKANPDDPQRVIRAFDEWHRTRGSEALRRVLAPAA